jgi:chromosomal replication initiator protein
LSSRTAADPTAVNKPAVISFPLEQPALGSRRRTLPTVRTLLPYFIAGEENRLAAFVAQTTTGLFEFGNPILLIGPSGSGKTVLALHLAARQATAVTATQGEPATVHYCTALDFARQYAEAIAADDLPPLRQEIHHAALWIVDDLHLIADKLAAQDELAQRIDGRTQLGRPTLVTCRRLPAEVRGIRSLLSSRVLPGLTIPMATPTGEARRQLLAELAIQLDLKISDDLLDSLHAELDSQLPARSLEAALQQVYLWSRMHDHPPTIEAVRSAVHIVGRSEEISLAVIAATVSKYFRMKLADLRSDSRKQNLVRARSLAMLLARRLTSKSMHQIGDYFGGRDHTTVLHAIRKTESLLEQDADLRRAADEVQEKLSAA